MTRADTPIGLVLAVVCVWVLWMSTRLAYWGEFAPGPGFAPLWLAGIGLLLSFLVAALARRPGLPRTPEETGGRAGRLRVALAVAGLAAMMVLIGPLGLLLALLVYLVFLTLAVQRLSVVTGLLASVGTVLFLYIVFQRALGVPFPTGPLGF